MTSPSATYQGSSGRSRAVRGLRACALVSGIALGIVLALTRPSAGNASKYYMIINPRNSTAQIDRAFVAQAFLKKVRRWPSGEVIDPVDFDQDSQVRRSWSTDLLGRSVQAVKVYWQQMIFSGRDLPPPEMASDAEVVDYVLRKAGGVGYVSEGADLRGAKVLAVRQ